MFDKETVLKARQGEVVAYDALKLALAGQFMAGYIAFRGLPEGRGGWGMEQSLRVADDMLRSMNLERGVRFPVAKTLPGRGLDKE